QGGGQGMVERMAAADLDDEADQLVEFVIGHDQHSVLRTQRSVSKLSRALTLLGRRNVDVTRSWFGDRSNSEPAAGFRGPLVRASRARGAHDIPSECAYAPPRAAGLKAPPRAPRPPLPPARPPPP